MEKEGQVLTKDIATSGTAQPQVDLGYVHANTHDLHIGLVNIGPNDSGIGVGPQMIQSVSLVGESVVGNSDPPASQNENEVNLEWEEGEIKDSGCEEEGGVCRRGLKKVQIQVILTICVKIQAMLGMSRRRFPRVLPATLRP